LLKYDSVLAAYQDVKSRRTPIIVGGKRLKVFAQRDPGELDWTSVGAQIVVNPPSFHRRAKGVQASAWIGKESNHLGAGQQRRLDLVLGS